MTKKLLLAAAAVGAMAFAGAASAGQITGAPRIIAKEATLPAAGLTGTITSGTDLTHDIAVAGSGEATYTVEYTLSGAEFTAAPTILTLGDAGVAGQGGTVYITTDNTAVAIITVKNTDTVAAQDLTGFSISAPISIAAQGTVKLSSVVSVNTGSVPLKIDEAAASTAVEFRPMILGFTSVAGSAEAKLPNYTNFGTSGGVPVTGAELADGFVVDVNQTSPSFYMDLNGASIDVDDVITGLTAKISGTAGAQLDKLELEIGTSDTVEPGATDVAAEIELDSADVASILGGAGVDFSINNALGVALNGATYSITFEPVYGQVYPGVDYSGAASFGPLAAGAVTLEGTNFTAPWFVLNNPNNTATLRLGNNGGTATGPVFVTLMSNNGTDDKAGTRVKVADKIEAGAIEEITSAKLRTLLGTDAQNGDLRVTVQGDGSVISGKVRIRNVTGALSEQSLGNLED